MKPEVRWSLSTTGQFFLGDPAGNSIARIARVERELRHHSLPDLWVGVWRRPPVWGRDFLRFFDAVQELEDCAINDGFILHHPMNPQWNGASP